MTGENAGFGSYKNSSTSFFCQSHLKLKTSQATKMKPFQTCVAFLAFCAVFGSAAEVEYAFGDDESFEDAASVRGGRGGSFS